MTPDQSELMLEVGFRAVEIFNIARGHDRKDAPCTCMICRAVYDKLSQYIKHNLVERGAVQAPPVATENELRTMLAENVGLEKPK